MRRFKYLVLLVFVWSCISKSSDISLTVRKDKIVFHNWHPKEQGDLSVFLWNDKEKKVSKTKVEGRFSYHKDVLEFVPNFPLLENTEFVLVRKENGVKKEQRFTLPKKKLKALEVVQVYPTADSLPENLLRMYINFSQPMKTSGNLEHIKLINATGDEVKGAIFNNVYELWDASQRQLTIIFDPARVKTDLVANKELGRALKPNEMFKLTVGNIEDIYGQKLKTSYEKKFYVIPQDTISPDVSKWEIQSIVSNTKQKLQIDFRESVDRMSLLNRIKVVDEDNNLIQGEIRIGDQEKEWQFVPDQPWEKKNCFLRINSRLADPSGNNLNGLFDHKAGSLKNDKEGEMVTIPLKVNE